MKKTVLFCALAMASGLAAASPFYPDTSLPTDEWDVVAQGNYLVSTATNINPAYVELRTGAYALPTTFLLEGTEPTGSLDKDNAPDEYVTYNLYEDGTPASGSISLGALLMTQVLHVGESFNYLLGSNAQYVLMMTLTGDSTSSTRISAVPLPGAALLFGTALLGAGAIGRKKLAQKRADAAAA